MKFTATSSKRRAKNKNPTNGGGKGKTSKWGGGRPAPYNPKFDPVTVKSFCLLASEEREADRLIAKMWPK